METLSYRRMKAGRAPNPACFCLVCPFVCNHLYRFSELRGILGLSAFYAYKYRFPHPVIRVF